MVIDRPHMRDHNLNTRMSLDRILWVTEPMVEKMVETTAQNAAQTKNMRLATEGVSGLGAGFFMVLMCDTESGLKDHVRSQNLPKARSWDKRYCTDLLIPFYENDFLLPLQKTRT